VLGGFAVGAASVMSPAYIAEVASARYRRRLATVQQIAIISGVVCAFLSNYLLAKVAARSTGILWLGAPAWRWMFWMQALPSLLFMLLLLPIPESPRYLVVKKRDVDALLVLTRCTALSAASVKLAEISASLAQDHHRPQLSDLINKATGKIRPIVWIGVGLATFQQLVGINVVFYYGACVAGRRFFRKRRAADQRAVGRVEHRRVHGYVLLIDRIGRKPLLWIGSIGMAVTLALLTFAFASASLDAQGKLALSSEWARSRWSLANVYVIFFNLSGDR
jgi:MFS family permease